MKITTTKNLMVPALVTLCVLALTVSRVAANPLQNTPPTSDTYLWYGELVGLEENARMMTVKSRVVGEQALKDLKNFRSGERITLTWSGFDKWADAILTATPYAAGKSAHERFTFPVEFVSFESETQYVTFKVHVPQTSMQALKALKPGDWITATAKHRPTQENDALVQIRSYVESATKTSD